MDLGVQSVALVGLVVDGEIGQPARDAMLGVRHADREIHVVLGPGEPRGDAHHLLELAPGAVAINGVVQDDQPDALVQELQEVLAPLLGRVLLEVVEHDGLVAPLADVLEGLAAGLLVDERALHVAKALENLAEGRDRKAVAPGHDEDLDLLRGLALWLLAGQHAAGRRQDDSQCRREHQRPGLVHCRSPRWVATACSAAHQDRSRVRPALRIQPASVCANCVPSLPAPLPQAGEGSDGWRAGHQVHSRTSGRREPCVAAHRPRQ